MKSQLADHGANFLLLYDRMPGSLNVGSLAASPATAAFRLCKDCLKNYGTFATPVSECDRNLAIL
jgi:hypothetical protein